MGQWADDALDGFVCQVCGQVIDEEEAGYARTCKGCQ